MKQLSILYKDIIRKNNLFHHLIISLNGVENIEYDFHYSKITDKNVKMLEECYTFKLLG
uniref:Uncharacterized protein n=1 Tax=viral metagenome TaxID=1070528 RepID=A0A6C0LR25_9ZZZZ